MAKKPRRQEGGARKLEQKRNGEGDEAGVAGRRGRRRGPHGRSGSEPSDGARAQDRTEATAEMAGAGPAQTVGPEPPPAPNFLPDNVPPVHACSRVSGPAGRLPGGGELGPHCCLPACAFLFSFLSWETFLSAFREAVSLFSGLFGAQINISHRVFFLN
jgi:hypothetical protein